MTFSSLALGFLLAFAACLGLTTVAIRVCTRRGWVSHPRQGRWHCGMPCLFGGVPIWFSFVLTAALFLPRRSVLLWELIGVSSLVFLIGLADDILKLAPRLKLLLQLLAASLVFSAGIVYPFRESLFLNLVVSTLWIVGITNAFNLLDNMDGLSAGVAVISSAYLVAIYSLRGGWDNVLVLSLLTGALGAFLIFNFQPARIFMGDAGSLFIGFLLAGISLLGVTHLSGLSSFLFIPILVLAVPILDTVFVSVTRRLRGQPISQGGTDHTSHRLVRLGINERRAVLVLYGLSAVSGGIAFAIHYISPLNAVVLVALWGLFLLLFAVHLFEPGAPGDATSLYPVLNRDALVILLDPIVLSLSYYLAFFFRFGEVTGDHWSAFLRSWPVLLAIKSVCLLSCGVYRRSWWRGGRQDLYRVLQASLLGDVLSVVVFVGAYRFYGYSRTVFALDGVVSSLLLIATRGSFQLFRDFVETVHGPAGGERRAAILGTDHSAQVAVPLLKHYQAWCIGLIETQREAGLARHIWGVPVLGHVDDLPQLIERYRIQDVVLPGSEPGALVESVIALAAQRNVRVLRLGFYEEPGSLRARAASAAAQDVNGAQ